MIVAKGHPEVVEILTRWDRRRRKAEALIWTPRGLLVGLLLSVVVATVARLRPILTNSGLMAITGGLALTGVLIGLFMALARDRSLIEKARFADRRFNLAERATASVEIANGSVRTSPDLADLQVRDAIRMMSEADARVVIPLQPNIQDLVLTATALVLLVAAVLLPNPQSDTLEERRAVSGAIDEQVEELTGLVEMVENNDSLTDLAQDALLAPIESALNDLSAGNLSQEAAVAALSEAEAELRALVDNNSQEALATALANIAGPLTENPLTQSLAQALQSGQLSAARTAAAELADRLPQLDEAERLELARDLAEAAAALQEFDTELASDLAQAAQDLASGQVASAQEALQEFAGDLQERAGQQALAQQASAAADQLAQGRQEVAQAGSGQGQPGDGAGDGPGQGNGQGQNGDGSGNGNGSGRGVDSGDSGAPTDQGSGQGGPGPGGGHAEALFVPDLVDLSGEAGVDIELPAECIANPESCGALLNQTPTEFGSEESLVPYDQVFGDYRDAAYRALDQNAVPLSLRDTVRDYFSSLEP